MNFISRNQPAHASRPECRGSLVLVGQMPLLPTIDRNTNID
jgi:hypothetical protein